MKNKLLNLLACPVCKKPLSSAGRSLACRRCRKNYPVKNGIPILIDEKNLPAHLQHQIRYFESAAAHYRAKHTLAPWERRYVTRFGEYLGGYKGKLLVDDASGSGYIALEAAKRGATVLACDLNLAGLVHIRRVADAMGVGERILMVCCSAESLPIRAGVADAIAANAILEHLPDDRAAAEDIDRIAKRGAIAMITVPLAYHLLNPLFLPINYLYDKRIGHLRRYTKETLSERFSGWNILKVTYTGHTRKVLKTFMNLIAPIFDERRMEIEDEYHAARKLFASNMSIIFKKMYYA